MNEQYPISDEKENTLCVKEENTEYVLEKDKTKQGGKLGNKKHDKIFKDILQNKEEIVQFINKFGNYQVKAEDLKRIVMYLYKNEDETTIKEIIKILEESECGEDMSTVAERIARELASERRAARAEGMMLGINEGISQGISQGILQTIKQIIEQMIKMNFEDATIKQVTGAKKSEIEKIRKEISKNT